MNSDHIIEERSVRPPQQQENINQPSQPSPRNISAPGRQITHGHQQTSHVNPTNIQPANPPSRNTPATPMNAQSVTSTPRHPPLRPVQSAPPGQVHVSPTRTYVTTNTIVNGKLVGSTGELPPGCPPIDVDAILRSAGLGPKGSTNVTTKTYSTTTTNRNVTVNGQPVANADSIGIFDNFDKLFENVDKDGNVKPDPEVLNNFMSKFSRSFSLPETGAPPLVTNGTQSRQGSVPSGAQGTPANQPGPPHPGLNQPGPGTPRENQLGPGTPGGNESGRGKEVPPVDVDAILRSVGLGSSGHRATSAPQGQNSAPQGQNSAPQGQNSAPQAQTKQSVHKTVSMPVANSKINICNGAKLSGNRVFIGGNVSSGGNGPDVPTGNLDINLGDGVEIEAKEELLIGCGNTRMDDLDLGGIGENESKKKEELAEEETKEKKMKTVSKAVCFITNDHGNTVGNGFFAEWEGFEGLAFITDGNMLKDNLDKYNLHFKSSGDVECLGAVRLSLKSLLGHRHEMAVASKGQRRVQGTGVDRLDDTDKENVYTALLLGPGFRKIIKDMDLAVLKINMSKEMVETVCYIGHTRSQGINGPLTFTNVKVESFSEHKLKYNLGQEGELSGGPLVDGDFCVRAIHVANQEGSHNCGQNINPVITDLYAARLRIIRRSLDGTGRRMC